MGKRLTDVQVRQIRHSGSSKSDERHGDGRGLMLSVKPSGAKSWVQKIMVRGRRRQFGLGAYPLVTLAEARQKALENQKIAREGGDPTLHRKKALPPDFRTAAEAAIAVRAGSWKPGGRSEAVWRTSLERYAYPRLGRMLVDEISPSDVLAVVGPMWSDKRETASRVRQRISAVMLWAIAHGWRLDNPAGDAVLQALPRGRAQPVQHMKALHWSAVPEAIATVRGTGAWIGTKLCFEFLVLTATRSGEARNAVWSEIDLDAAVCVTDRPKGATADRLNGATRKWLNSDLGRV